MKNSAVIQPNLEAVTAGCTGLTAARVLEPTAESGEDNAANEPLLRGESEGVTRRERFVVGCIIVTEMCERLAYYSVLANMVLFCTSELDLSNDQAAVVTLVFSGTVYIMPVFGGFIADEWAGKFNTILRSGLIYVIGLILLEMSSIDYRDWFKTKRDLTTPGRKAMFFTSLVLVAIGTGGIKANIGPFGAQQVEHRGTMVVQSYFNWFYWVINVGAITAFTGVAYVQQERGFNYGYLIPLICMVLAITVFVSARSKYKNPGPEGTMFVPTLEVILSVFCGMKSPLRKQAHRQPNGKANKENIMDSLKAVIRVLPVFGTLVIYWAVYSQMSTSLFLQSERLDMAVGNAVLPAAILNIFNSLVIIALIPILNWIIYPFLEKRGRNPTNLQRIGIGLMLALCSMLYAGILEIVRKKDISNNGLIRQYLAGESFNASSITMFAQIPEFAFIGSSEVFVSVSGLEFAYTQAPSSMQGLIVGIYFFTCSLGSYFASLIIVIVRSWKTSSAGDWFPAELNDGHLEYLLFLMAGLTFLDVLLFIAVARWYRRKKLQLMENMDGNVQTTPNEYLPVEVN